MTFDQVVVVNETSADLRLSVQEAMAGPYQRVARHRTRQGSVFWLKRVERSVLLFWLVKGTPKKAFDRDRRSHRFLWERGVPVPAIVAEGEDYIALEDVGVSLTRIHKDATVPTSEKTAACVAAGRALARLHSVNLAHGRPAFRDMCWDGSHIRFIDFEYFVPSKAGFARKARDVSIATLSALSQGLEGPRCAFSVLTAYAAAIGKRPGFFVVPRRRRQ